MHVNDVVNKKNWKGNKIMERIKGLIDAPFTPFYENGEVNLEPTVGKIYTQEKFHFCQLVYLELWEW